MNKLNILLSAEEVNQVLRAIDIAADVLKRKIASQAQTQLDHQKALREANSNPDSGTAKE